MSDPTNSWDLYIQAKEWGQRPSDLLFIDDAFVSFCVNEAVHAFGEAIEVELNSLKKGKSENDEAFNRRRRQLFLKLIEAPDEQRFSSPTPTK